MITRLCAAVCICCNSVRWAYADTASGITPQSIIRPLEMGLAGILNADYADLTDEAEAMHDFATQQEVDDYIGKLESDMREDAKLRDTVKELRTKGFLFS